MRHVFEYPRGPLYRWESGCSELLEPGFDAEPAQYVAVRCQEGEGYEVIGPVEEQTASSVALALLRNGRTPIWVVDRRPLDDEGQPVLWESPKSRALREASERPWAEGEWTVIEVSLV